MLMSCLECNLHLETCVCVCVFAHVNAWWGEDLLGYKERHIAIIIQMSSEST